MHRIRLATPADGTAVAGIYRPVVESTVISFEVDAPTAAEMAARIELTGRRTPWLVWEEDGTVLGYAYASMHRERAAYQWAVDVSAYVRGDQHRRGIARSLYSTLFPILVLQGYRIAYAGITLPNDASVGLHTQLGFAPVGTYRKVGYKMGAWHDVLWLERELAERRTEPARPLPLPELAGLPELERLLREPVDSAARRTTTGIEAVPPEPIDGGRSS
jgi:phosphinothricin acetyltransferase